MVEIGHLLAPDVERAVEPFVNELNVALVRNEGVHADLVGKLRAADIERERADRARWDAQVILWREKKSDMLVHEFQKLMQTEGKRVPLARLETLQALDAKQLELSDSFLGLLYSLQTESSPSLDPVRSAELEGKFTVHAGTLAAAHAAALASLSDCHQAEHELNLRLFDELCEEVVACGLMDAAEARRVLGASCLSLVDDLKVQADAVHAAVAGTLASHRTELGAVALTVTGFLSRCASIWSEHARSAQAVLDQSEADRLTAEADYAAEIQRNEEILASQLDALRHAPNMRALEERLKAALEHLAGMEISHRSRGQSFIEAARALPAMLEEDHQHHQLLLARSLLLFHPGLEHAEAEAKLAEEQLERERQAEAEAAQAKQDAAEGKGPKGKDKPKKDDASKVPASGKITPSGEKDKKGSRKDPSSAPLSADGSAGDTGAPTKPKGRVEDVDIVTSARGEVYEISEPWEEEKQRQRELLLHATESAAPSGPPAAAVLDASPVKGKSQPPGSAEGGKKGKKSKVDLEAEERERAEREEAARLRESERLRKEAEEKARRELMFSTPVPPLVVIATIKSAIRRNLVDYHDVFVTDTLAVARARAKELVDLYEDRLAATLRAHAPRAVSVEMGEHAARKRELSQNRTAYERHVATARSKLEALQKSWKNSMDSHGKVVSAQLVPLSKSVKDMAEINNMTSFEGHERK